MGRYYSGSIEGKFMFAVQSSDAPERFGAIVQETGYIEYVVLEDRIEEVIETISKLEDGNKRGLANVEKMFRECEGYNDDTQKKYNVTQEDLSDYADLRLGKQIRDFILKEKEDCYISAEL
jgi:hypothetical protein